MMQSEFYQLSSRLNLLEIKHGEFNIIQQHINSKLESIEKLIQVNQDIINAINLQLAARKIRVNTLKTALITMTTLTAALSSLHIKPVLAVIEKWLA